MSRRARVEFLLVVLAVLLVGSVHAVSMGLPQDLGTSLRVDVGENRSLVFVLRGDAQQKTVRFFMDGNGVATIDGVGVFSENVTLAPFESREIVIQVLGSRVASGDVEYGYSEVESSSGSIGFQTVMKKSFLLEVGCHATSCPEYVYPEVNVTAPVVVQSSSGGGGGGGGRGDVLNTPVSSKEVVAAPQKGSDAVGESRMQDVVGEGSQIAQGVAQTQSGNLPGRLVAAAGNVVKKVIASSQARFAFFMMISLLVMSLAVQVGVFRMMRKSDEGDAA